MITTNQACDGSVPDEVVEAFKERLAAAIRPMTDVQVLDIADTLHSALDRRRTLRDEYGRAAGPETHCLDLAI